MPTEVIVALIAFAGAVVGALIGARANSNVSEARQDAKIEELHITMQMNHESTQKAIARLEKKQDKHNEVIERTYEIEKRLAIVEEKQHGHT